MIKNNTEKNIKKAQRLAQIMGVNVLSTTKEELLMRVKDKITHSNSPEGRSQKFSILTPNSELVLMAQSNKELKDTLNSCDFPVPDTVGLKYAYKFLYGENLNIIPGRKLFLDLVDLANKEGWRVFFLGGLDNEAELAKLAIENSLKIGNCKLKIETAGGPQVSTNLSKDIVDKINAFNPHLLFVAFGNPKQEIWVHDNLPKLNILGAMAIGGTFRYVAGLSKLPPKWMEQTGLEWLWRLVTEPHRIGRVWNAVIVFSWKVFWSKSVRL